MRFSDLMQPVAVRRVNIPVVHSATAALPQLDGAATVLLVTEDEELRSTAGRALAEAGYRVVEARHAGHAILACLAGPRVDILVAELSMDEGSGPALSARLRKFHPALRAVFLARAGALERVEHVLVRPFTRDDLLARVRTALEAGQ